METIHRILEMDLPRGQCAFLWGARKTGKTTYLRQTFPGSAFIDLLDSDVFFALAKRPALFRERVEALPAEQRARPVIVDEIQKLPVLLDEVHLLAERHGLGFVLCGSSARKLRRGHVNLLGGRAWRYELTPFVPKELADFDLLRALRFGLLPPHYLRPRPERSLTAYVQDYLKEEIREEGLTRNLPAFSRFLDAVGHCCGELVNLANIARDCGVSAATVREYFLILEDTLVGSFLTPYAQSRSRQVLTATPKFYFFDVGVANHVARRVVGELRGETAGRAFEHFILMQFLAYRAYCERDFSLHYWRTKTGLEVDFILARGRRGLAGIEVKCCDDVPKSELRGLAALSEETGIDRLVAVSLDPLPRRVELAGGKVVQVWPWKVFLERLWQGELDGD
jgi:predicted AAA+ superfamily ATPase